MKKKEHFPLCIYVTSIKIDGRLTVSDQVNRILSGNPQPLDDKQT